MSLAGKCAVAARTLDRHFDGLRAAAQVDYPQLGACLQQRPSQREKVLEHFEATASVAQIEVESLEFRHFDRIELALPHVVDQPGPD
jgi:hypothetical protein